MAGIDLSDAAGRIEALRRMMLIRRFDERTGDLFGDGELAGFVHLYIGQEAVAVGACFALEEDDYIASTHRGHGHCLAKGLDPKYMLAELYGKETGYNNGKGGSMHIADVDAGMLGANGIVGAGGCLTTGAALTQSIQSTDQVALGFAGDGATPQGHFHEALNLAGTWDLPAIFLIENNQYGEGTPSEQQHPIDQLSDLATAYGMPGRSVDGMDVREVYEAVEEARTRAASGEGPSLIEAETYRYRGHFEGDHEPYRDEEEVERWKQRDPIDTYRERLTERGDLDEGEFEAMDQEIERTLDEAVEFAREAPYPEPEQAYDDLFEEEVPELEEFARRMHSAGVGGDQGE